LIVGDSVRGSLRALALDRLGQIDHVLVSGRFFREALSEELAADPDFQSGFSAAVPAVLFPRATVETQGKDPSSRATGVLLIGANDDFWNLGDPAARPNPYPGADEIVLNTTLAQDLGVQSGDRLLLRLPKSSEVPADSTLGKKEDLVQTIVGLKVVAIVPDRSLGRFSLSASQATPRNAFVALETIQDALEQEGRINALLVGHGADSPPTDSPAAAAPAAMLQPRLEDYGIQVQRVRRTFRAPGSETDEVVFDYFHATTNRMLLEPAAAEAIQKALKQRDIQAVSTYVVNAIATPDRKDSEDIPYSLVTGIESRLPFGPLLDEAGQPILLADDQIVLNGWAAADLNAQVGDRIALRFYRPEATHGKLEEDTAYLTLGAIVPLTEPATSYSRRREATYDQRPTTVNDPALTPEVEGVTDQDSIESWEAPFPVDYSLVRSQDDDYWQNHRTTPKAFVSLETARTLWGSRFGYITSFRIPVPLDLPPGSDAEAAHLAQLEMELAAALRPVMGRLGFEFQPIRQRSLAAAAGTTPFDVLFLALSMFVILAALILVMLLFRLAVEQRASEIGTLLAVGFPRPRTAGLLIAEGGLVAAVGGLLGVAAGTGYAWLMIAGLQTWWVGAIATPFLQMFVSRGTLAAGYLSGVLVCAATIGISLRFMRRTAVRSLLAGRATDEAAFQYRSGRWWWLASAALLAVSLGLAVMAARSGGETQAASFVGAGAAVLAALLIAIRGYLRSGGRSFGRGGGLSLPALAARNAARNPTRSTMTVGLMAVASFLIIAMGAFRAEPTDRGTGGFNLMAESDRPVFENLNTDEGRDRLLGTWAEKLQGSMVFGLRVQAGDDAACTNLYRPSQPRVLGVPPSLIEHFDGPDAPSFGWAASAARSTEQRANPWRLLESERRDDGTIPVVLDMNTAMYSLQLYRGIGEEFEIQFDMQPPIRFRVVGLLTTCILQGSLLIHEQDFLREFPAVAGYQMFLIRTAEDREERVASVLEDRLSDSGFDVTSAARRLDSLLAVQNTYLSTFQTLGALGLLLGTFGLATVQIRNVVERRSELALMRATGFRRARLALMVLQENVALLLAGLLSGFFAAMVAVVPHVVLGGASVPLRDLTVTLGIILLVGILSSLTSVRTTLRAPLLPALRGD
jgi:putative ABC transport system permease protein